MCLTDGAMSISASSSDGSYSPKRGEIPADLVIVNHCADLDGTPLVTIAGFKSAMAGNVIDFCRAEIWLKRTVLLAVK